MKSLIILVAFVVTVITPHYAQDVADFSTLKINNVGNDGKMLDFAFSSDQSSFAIANENKVLKIFDGRTGKFIKQIKGHQDNVVEIRLTHDGSKLISLGFDNTLALIDVKTGSILQTIKFGTKLRCLDIDPGGRLAVIGDKKGFIHYVNLEKGEVIKKVSSGAPQVSSISFSPDYSMIAAGTGVAVGYMIKKNPILLLSLDGKVIKSFIGSQGATTSMKFSNDGKWLYSGHKANTRSILKWNLETGENGSLTETVNFISNSGYNSIEVDAKSSLLIATTDDNAIEIYDLATNQRASSIKGKGRTKIRLARKLDHFPKRIFPVNGGKNFVIGGFNQNLLYIFNSLQRGVVGYIHSFNDQWAVIAADGRMDGSLEAIRNLSWKVGFDEIPLEDTFDRNFYPLLLSQLIKEEEARAEFKVENFVSKVPKISISSVNGERPTSKNEVLRASSTKRSVNLEINIDDHKNEVKEVRVYNNSKLVATLPGDPTQNKYPFNLNLTDANGSENYIYAVASSKSGIDSEKKKLVINYEGSSDAKPKLYLVTVGINKYRNPKYNLNYALADANSIHETVRKGADALFDKVVQYNIRDSKATRTTIMKTFQEIESEALEQDMLLFYYAGHGVMSDGGAQDFYLVPYDVTQLYGRNDLLQQKAVSASELKELSKKINAQKQVFILDACQSAGALDAVVRGAAEERAIAQLARSTGTFWITATGSDQFATEFEALGHGVFTYSILEGLTGKADNGDKKLTVKELSAYIESRVPELSEKYKGTPQFPSGYSFGNDFPLAIIGN
ncbi:MAG: caspase family protein [Bacteroidota bacterium]